MIGSSKPLFGFHKYQSGQKKKEEEKKKSPTKPFEDAAKATEGLRENIKKMGDRQKSKEEEEKKKKEGTGVQPAKGFFGRMMDKYRSK